jgi:hypothetical protein
MSEAVGPPYATPGDHEQLRVAASPSPDPMESALDLTIFPSDLKRDAHEFPNAPEINEKCKLSPTSTPGPTSARDSAGSYSGHIATSVQRLDPGPIGTVVHDTGGVGATPGGALASERVYDPQLHFASACGEDDENIRHLVTEANLFFLCELASLHSAIREDELAAQLLWRARPYSDGLPSNHPDTALVWCGIGRIAYLTGDYDIAARSTARARRIREKTIGGDTVESATTYNNLACCLASLDRPLEAQALLELGAELLKVLLGEDHPRSQTALRNLEKVRSFDKNWKCKVPHLFGIPVKQRLKGGRLRRKKGKKGTKDGGSAKSSVSGGSRKSVASSNKPKKAKAKKKGAR